MAASLETHWLQALIAALQGGQLALLHLLAALGLTESPYGQPAWPWPWRLSGENLLIDLGQARRAGIALIFGAAACLMLLAALLWRRARWYLIATTALVALSIPWPDPAAVLVPANPTSFHVAPSAVDAKSLVRGGWLYAQHCAACHGDDLRGQGERAKSLAVWPPNLAGPLMWRRADGDLVWHVLHGVHDDRGHETMPGFHDTLSSDDAWALLDYLKVRAAGETLKSERQWTMPVRVADTAVDCPRGARQLASWRGQRLRLYLPARPAAAAPMEDPRLVTVRVEPGAPPSPDGCVASAPEIAQTLAWVAGVNSPAGLQFIVDREGYLRARSSPDRATWSEGDLLCKSGGTAPTPAPPQDGLGALIARMDAEPVRFVKGGVVH